MSVFKMNTTFSNVKLNYSTFNANKSVIQFHEKQPNLEIRLKEVGLCANFNYSVISDPDLVDDTGYGTLLIEDLNLTLQVSLYESNNFFGVKLNEIAIEIDDFDLNLEQGDLAYPIDYYSKILKESVRHNFFGVITNETTQSIEDYINEQLLLFPREFVFDNFGLAFNQSLVHNGVMFKDRYVSFLLDGTMQSINKNNLTKNFSEMPIHNPESEDIQIFLSEYFINQLLQSAIDQELFQYTLANQTSDNIDAIVSEFEQSFGDHKNVSIFIQGARNSSLHTSKIQITPKETVIDFGIEINIQNPYDNTQNVAQIIAKMTCNMIFSIDENLIVQGDVDQLKLDVIELRTYYVTKTQAKDINSRLAILSPLLSSYVNKQLDDGFKIPIPKELAKYIKKEKITSHEGYLLIDGDVDFKNFEESLIGPSIKPDTTDNSTKVDNQTDAVNSTYINVEKDQHLQTLFRVSQQMRRNLQDQNKKKFREPVEGGGKAHFSPEERQESQERFYFLVEQVYKKNSESDSNQTQTYKTPADTDELMVQVQDFLNGNLSETLTNDWTPEMKEAQKQIQEDYNSGKLQFGDLDLSRIAQISWNSISKAIKNTVKDAQVLGDAIEGELKNDLEVLEDAGKQVGGWIGGLFGGN
eukprot:403335808